MDEGQTRQFDCQTFERLLARLEEGELSRDLTKAYHEVVNDIQAQGRGTQSKVTGEIKLAIKLTYDDGQVVVAAGLSTKIPDMPRGKTRLYALVGEKGLSLQPQLPLGQRPVRDVAAPTVRDTPGGATDPDGTEGDGEFDEENPPEVVLGRRHGNPLAS